MVVTGTSRDYAPYHDLMTTLRDCMAKNRQVSLNYHSFSRVKTDRIVDPYALSLRWGNWYLVGYCHLRDELRTFRIDRISNLVPLDGTFVLPRDFDAKNYLETTMHWEDRYEVVLWASPIISAEMNERAGDWIKVENKPDGSAIVRFDADNLNWAAGWVLSWGRTVKVLEPPELVARVKEDAEEILKNYQL